MHYVPLIVVNTHVEWLWILQYCQCQKRSCKPITWPFSVSDKLFLKIIRSYTRPYFQPAVPSPNVSISVPNTTLHAGSTVNLTCTVTLAREIDVSVTLNVTWLRGSTVIGNDTISAPSSSNVFTSVHTLSSLDANDNNITCLAKIFPERISLFLTSSLPHSVSKSLDIEGKSYFSLL